MKINEKEFEAIIVNHLRDVNGYVEGEVQVRVSPEREARVAERDALAGVQATLPGCQPYQRASESARLNIPRA